jgi:hypothetical protein
MADWKQSNPIIKREDVLMVYSGIAGCMCGCLGNYRYPKGNKELGKTQRGYEIKPEEINDAQVTRVLKKMATLTDVEVGEIYGKSGDSLFYCWTDDETRRRYAVYTKPGAPYTKPEGVCCGEPK